MLKKCRVGNSLKRESEEWRVKVSRQRLRKDGHVRERKGCMHIGRGDYEGFTRSSFSYLHLFDCTCEWEALLRALGELYTSA